MRFLASLLFAALALSFAAATSDVTFLDTSVDLPPPTKEQVFMVQKLREMTPWSKVKPADLDLETSDDDEDSVAHDDSDEEIPEHDSETVAVPKADVLDVSFDDLVPKIDNPSFARMRAAMAAMRRQLQPMHRHLCSKDTRQCEQRRHLNAQIMHDVLRSHCYKRNCNMGSLVSRRIHSMRSHMRVVIRSHCARATAVRPRRCRKVRHCCHGRNCSICTKGAKALRLERKRYHNMHKVYTRLYIRYALSLAKYYQAKFKTLAKVFLTTVHRIQQHITKVKAQNVKLSNQIMQLKADDKEFTRRKASEHAEREKKMKQLAAKHNAHVQLTAKTIADAKANIAAQKIKQGELQRAIDETRKRLQDAIADRNKHKAETEKMEAEAKNLEKSRGDLTKKLADLEAQLAAAKKRIADLTKLVEDLKNQVALLQQAVAAARVAGTKAKNARDDIQTRYNNLLRQYQQAINTNSATQTNMKNQIENLRDLLRELVERCVADPCGVCGGDESSCANTNARATCYAVGDPHYRTYDGMTMDFQYDGQFIIAKHGQNFELQNLQRLASAPWHPRLNKGIAMRCGMDVVIVYEEWGFGRALINGVSHNLPLGQWLRVGDGCSVLAQNGDNAQFRYEFRGQAVVVTMSRSVWPYGNFINLYVDVPWQWSSGRSLWGLCGDFDAWVGNDRLWIDRNWQARFIVTNSANDFFRFPHRRTDILIQEGNVGDKELEKRLDKANNVAPAELFVEENAEVQAKMHADLAQAVFAPLDNTAEDTPHHHIDFHGVDPKVLARAQTHCGRVQKAPTSQTLKQCVFDVLNGMRGAAWLFGMANIEGHEKELKRCTHISSDSFNLVVKSTLPHEESAEEGFSVALWFQPTDQPTEPSSILERGTSALVIAQSDDNLVVNLGTNSCTCEHVLPKDEWTSIVVAVHRQEGGKVFVNRKVCCKVPLDLDGEGFRRIYSQDIVIGGAGDNVAEGNVAHVFYVPNAITAKLAKVHGDVAPTECKPDDD